MLLKASTGSYPRPDRLIQTLKRAAGLQKGARASVPEVEAAYRQALAGAIRDQRAAGLDWLTDGQFRWDDFLAHPATGLGNVEMGGIIRFYDNNNYYRRPHVRGPLRWKKSLLAGDYQAARRLAGRKMKAVLPGPYTLAVLSEDHHYGSPEKLVGAYAQVLNREARSLARAGAHLLQWDEPALAQPQADRRAADLARRGLQSATRGIKATHLLMTYFGYPKRTLRELPGFPAAGIGLDIVSANGARPLKLEDRILVLGCIDARTTRMEDPRAVAARVRPWVEKSRAREIHLAPNSGLEFLPAVVARQKLKLLRAVARAVDA